METAVSAHLIELFQSIQGEGPHIGECQTFLRFQGCHIGCTWCDTPASFENWSQFRVEESPGSKRFTHYPNPASPETVMELLHGFPAPTLSLTGGEPLEQSGFLRRLLPALNRRTQIFLETAGTAPQALSEIITWVDTVSMDFKLPSSTRVRPYWKEHETFLKIAAAKEVACKIVLTADTAIEDLIRACELIVSVDRTIPLILQPVSNRFDSVDLEKFLCVASAHLTHIRILPQLHKMVGWL